MGDERILLVEDEPNIASLVEMYLGKEGYRVAHVTTGADALDRVEAGQTDLVVLDVMLPGMDGLEVCRRIRAHGPIPIVMLTARDSEVDKVLGLELGADDYVTKPFSPRELVARIRAVLRRVNEPAAHTEERSALGPVTVDEARRAVRVDGHDVELTAREFDLLAYLARNRGIVCSRDRLLEQVWGYERAIDTRTVDSHVKTLRQKLGTGAVVIKTVRGVGYKADAP